MNSPQDGNTLHLKVTEVIPKFTFLGKNLDEALNLQKQHEDLLLNIQVRGAFLKAGVHLTKQKKNCYIIFE